VTVTAAVAHGLSTGSVVFIDGVYTSPGGGLNGSFTVTVTSPTQFTYQTPDFAFASSATAGSVLPFAAPPQDDSIFGPYIFDQDGLSITSVSTTVQTAISKGRQAPILAVADATAFPDQPGWLVLGFGTSNQQGPVQYFGRVSNGQLFFDQNFTFKADASIGTDVTLLLTKGTWIPDDPALGAFYLTASPAGRVAASATLDQVIAAGFNVDKTILYPGDRGLGGEGLGSEGIKLSDVVWVWAGDDVDAEVAAAHLV
jgi:hypothetical protein